MVSLRSYQLDLVERAGAVAKGKRVVFAAHLDALLDDTSERLTRAGSAVAVYQRCTANVPGTVWYTGQPFAIPDGLTRTGWADCEIVGVRLGATRGGRDG